MCAQANQDDAPTVEQVRKAVRVFGIINLVLGAYMLLGALTALGGGAGLPLSSGRRFAQGLGLVAALVVWGPALAGGLGLVLLTNWGRKLAIVWGRAIVWVLPIGFGLSADGLRAFISLAFAVVIVICLYAQVLAQNLGRDVFDVAFE